MRIFKRILPLLLAAALIAAFAGCRGKLKAPGESEKPSAMPTESVSPTEAAASEPAGSELTSEMPSGEPSGSPDTGAIEGFMEGGVVDPDDVPALMEAISGEGEYDGMSIQSVTYKLFEGRQAYYVVLQGEGDASRQLYVFADGTITADD